MHKVIDTLYHELEVTHRYLQGKYEALEILQGQVEHHSSPALSQTVFHSYILLKIIFMFLSSLPLTGYL